MMYFHIYSTRLQLTNLAEDARALEVNRRIPWWQRQVFRLARRLALKRLHLPLSGKL